MNFIKKEASTCKNCHNELNGNMEGKKCVMCGGTSYVIHSYYECQNCYDITYGTEPIDCGKCGNNNC